jgi:hypothetical protein
MNHLEEAKRLLQEEGLRVFTEDQVFQACFKAGVSTSTANSQSVVIKALGFKKASIKSPFCLYKLCYWPDATIFEIGQAINRRAYLSQLGALGFHGLAPVPLNHLVINEEQSPKPQSSTPLRQAAIDGAFRQPQRISNNVAVWSNGKRENSFYLTNSKSTQKIGVVLAACGPTTIKVTSVARTLIDSAVRPFYGGGVPLILRAYRIACEKYKPAELVEEIIHLLPLIGHKYPYHQTIGFYFQAACPSEPVQTWQPLKDFGLEFKFYLTYQMEAPRYDSKWGVYYPEDLDI